MAQARVAADKKGAKRRRLHVVFLDESGFMLQPVRRRTWAPSGQTPIQDAWDRHDRLSVIGLIDVAPSREHLSLFFQVLQENVAAEHMIWFLRQLHRYRGRKVIVIWDRSSVHRSAAAYFKDQRPDWFEFEELPSYAPELNPIEQCWNHTKHADLPNFIPDDLDELDSAVTESINHQRGNPTLLRSFFEYTQLPL
jgi:transposase